MERTTRADTNLVNLSEASRRLQVSYVTLWRWIKKGKVTPVRILGLPYLTLDQVESLKNEKNNQATERPVA
jgi:predicted site-specific integrase-resolvase